MRASPSVPRMPNRPTSDRKFSDAYFLFSYFYRFNVWRGRLRKRAGKTPDPGGIRSAFIRPAEKPAEKRPGSGSRQKTRHRFCGDGRPARTHAQQKPQRRNAQKNPRRSKPAPGKSGGRAIALRKRERRCFSKSRSEEHTSEL